MLLRPCWRTTNQNMYFSINLICVVRQIIKTSSEIASFDVPSRGHENGQFLFKYYKCRFVGTTQSRSFGTPNFDKFRTFFAKTWAWWMLMENENHETLGNVIRLQYPAILMKIIHFWRSTPSLNILSCSVDVQIWMEGRWSSIKQSCLILYNMLQY